MKNEIKAFEAEIKDVAVLTRETTPAERKHIEVILEADLDTLPAITKRPPRTPESLAYIEAIISEYAEVEVINP